MFNASDSSGDEGDDGIPPYPPPRVRRGSVYIGHISEGKEPQGMWIGCFHVGTSVLVIYYIVKNVLELVHIYV